MASSLPEELVQEILVRLPPDEPVHLARASLVCKSWRRVLTDRDCFLRRYRGFHGGAPPPPLLGYIQNRRSDDYPMKFVPATTTSPVRMPAVDYTRWVAIDCRHGRVLIHFRDPSKRRFVVWDPITGSQQQLSVPSSSYSSRLGRSYTGAVLCAKDGCDHLDCSSQQADDDAGPFRVVFVETNLRCPIVACATNYSSLTDAWGAPAPNQINHNSNYCIQRGDRRNSLLIGDAIYFAFEDSASILRYDLRTHCLSEIDMPRPVYVSTILIKAEGGGLGLAGLSNGCITIWSQQDVTNGTGEWVQHRVTDHVEPTTLLPSYVQNESYRVVGFAEGTNTIFVNISTGIFTFDLKSKKVSKVGEREADRLDHILPYMRFYTPRSS